MAACCCWFFLKSSHELCKQHSGVKHVPTIVALLLFWVGQTPSPDCHHTSHRCPICQAAMPLYELFCVARPALSRSECITLIQNAASAVLQRGGILTDIKSFGERELAYEIRRPGLRMNEVCSHGISGLLSARGVAACHLVVKDRNAPPCSSGPAPTVTQVARLQ